MLKKKNRTKKIKQRKTSSASLKLVLFILVLGLSGLFILSFEDKETIEEPKKETVKKELCMRDLNLVKQEERYLALGEEYILSDEKVLKLSSDSDSVAFDGSKITAVKKGDAHIWIEYENYYDEMDIHISDLIHAPELNNKKPMLPCGIYSEEENDELDLFLSKTIEQAGYQTRAGAVAAARFLALQFPYRLAYFFENGRLSGGNVNVGDGEGRFYHKGLYLNDSRYSMIEKKTYGPKTWGCRIFAAPVSTVMSNGLDCSGFVSWTLYNAGYDLGDIGAGPNPFFDYTDVGEKVSKYNIDPEEIRVGDLIGLTGHIAIVIGIDEENLYIAEELEPGIRVRTTKKSTFKNSPWEYVMKMDGVYEKDGDLHDMW